MITIAKKRRKSSSSKGKKKPVKRKTSKKPAKKAVNSSSHRPRVGKSRLQPLHFGLAVGITWGLGIFCLGLIAAQWFWGIALVNVLSSLYTHFSPTFQGSLYGLVWGFVDGFLGGYIVAWLYNWMEHVR